ncbi:putative holin-like toxin [Enterococcus sp. 5B3_DIV0040]|uniref:putative holin-like toxin n=1 Tax=Enterococcus sp. 5B3_DIV0040 TaxID=1834182 RepID=UPI0020CF6FAF|nr:putative holin-like toxin [Enterococcus sp. 5B3_DIV0040]
MYVSIKSRERKRLLSVSEALGLMINFGTLIIALIALVVTLIKQNKNSRHFSGYDYFL